jgi:hypothetical protein
LRVESGNNSDRVPLDTRSLLFWNVMLPVRSKMEGQDTWQEWLFVASYLGLLAFVMWGVLIRK